MTWRWEFSALLYYFPPLFIDGSYVSLSFPSYSDLYAFLITNNNQWKNDVKKVQINT